MEHLRRHKTQDSNLKKVTVFYTTIQQPFHSAQIYQMSSSSLKPKRLAASVMRYTQDRSNKSEEWDAAPVDNYPWLFIGSLSALESNHHLMKNNITRILTVARRLPIPTSLPDSIVEHCVVEIDDHPRANFLEDAAHKCREFIDTALLDFESYNRELKKISNTDESGDFDSVDETPPPSILVHCASGISRSATAIVMWLMSPKRVELSTKVTLAASETTSSISITQALMLIRKNRPTVHPNIGFMMQLQVLEKQNGDLGKATLEWNENNKVEIYDLVSTRRQMANDIHAKVDEIEVRNSFCYNYLILYSSELSK